MRNSAVMWAGHHGRGYCQLCQAMARPGMSLHHLEQRKEVSKYLIIMRLGRIGVRLTHSATFQVMQAKLLQPEGALHRGITKPVILKQVQHIAIIYTLGSAPVELYTIKFQHLLFRFLLLNASKRHSQLCEYTPCITAVMFRRPSRSHFVIPECVTYQYCGYKRTLEISSKLYASSTVYCRIGSTSVNIRSRI